MFKILQTDLHTFLLRAVERILVYDQSILPLVINLVILITFTLGTSNLVMIICLSADQWRVLDFI